MLGERSGNDFLIELQFTKSFLQRTVGDKSVCESGAEGALDGAVGEVALEARDREFAGEMSKQCVCDTEIAFCVFKIDRIDLVGLS